MNAGLPPRLKGWEFPLICLVTLLAFVLRVYLLDAQSMWSDEGLSLYRARLSLGELFQNTIVVDGIATRDTNPPFYFLLLNLWQRVAGDSVFVLRYVSVLAGLLSVPLLYRLGRLVGSPRSSGLLVGLGAAFLLAISPFHIWMSQELRNYAPLVLLNLFSVYGLFRYLIPAGRQGVGTAGGRRWLVLWAGAGLLGIYTHYFGFFVMAYGALALALAFVWRRWRPPLWLVVLAALLLLITLPILPVALGRFRAGQQIDFALLPPGVVMRQALNAYAVGISPSLGQPLWRVLPVALTALAGLGLLFRCRQWAAAWLVLGYAAFPLVILLLLSQLNPLYNGPRHVLIGLPPFLILVACGVLLWPGRLRFVGWLLGLFLLISQGQWLWVQYHDPALAKDDVRGAAEFLNQHATANDLIVLHDTLIQFTFEHYYDGAAPVTAIPPLWQQDVDAAIAELVAAGDGPERLWFLVQPTPRTGFPEDTLRRWADSNWPRFADLQYAGLWLRVALNGYTPEPSVADLPEGVTPLDVTFGRDFRLSGFSLPSALIAGETAWPVLYLSRLEPEPGNYTLSFRLIDEGGEVWGQADGLLWRRFPPVDWPEDALLRYDHALALPGGLPPGEYQLRLRALGSDLQPLPVSAGGVDAYIGSVQVLAGDDPAQLPAYTTQPSRLGPVTLLGYKLPESAILPGHLAPLELFWQVHETPATDFVVQVELLDQEGEVMVSFASPPTRADYPPTAWQPGELLQGRAPLVLSGSIPPGEYRLRLTLRDPSGEQAIGRSIVLDEAVEVGAWPTVTELPDIETPLRADFGQPALIELHGYELTEEPGVLSLTLFWRSASATIPENYSVFVHLVNEGGEIVAQADGAPAQGLRPTIGWRDGEVIVDNYRLALPPDLPSGVYRLYVGLYDPADFSRLPVTVEGESQPGDRLLLEEWLPEGSGE